MNQPGNSFLSAMTHRTHLLRLLWLLVTIRMEHVWLCTCPFGVWSLVMSPQVHPLALPFHSFPVASHFKPSSWSPSLGSLSARGFLEPPLGPPAPYLHGQDLAFCLVAPMPDGNWPLLSLASKWSQPRVLCPETSACECLLISPPHAESSGQYGGPLCDFHHLCILLKGRILG